MSDDQETPTRDAVVTLREVTADSLDQILGLKVNAEQEQFVANNAVSIAEAYFEEKAWFRAIYADETPVGFLMLYDDPDSPTYYLWRFMIDARYQGSGFGRRALELLIEHVRTRPNATELTLSYVPADGSPQPFYAGLGFIDTGEIHDGENVMRLTLSD
jgi:diamine N-acetyltransferase